MLSPQSAIRRLLGAPAWVIAPSMSHTLVAGTQGAEPAAISVLWLVLYVGEYLKAGSGWITGPLGNRLTTRRLEACTSWTGVPSARRAYLPIWPDIRQLLSSSSTVVRTLDVRVDYGTRPPNAAIYHAP